MNILSTFQFFLFLLIFDIVIFRKLKYLSYELQITIKIQGQGLQMIFSNYYLSKPTEHHSLPKYIILNGNKTQNISNIIEINSDKEINTVILKWETDHICTSWMFQNCINIIEVDLSLCKNFVIRVQNSIRCMFENCTSLKSVIFGDFLKDERWDWMENIFYNCFSLLSVDLSGMDTSTITDMNKIFYNCSSLTSLDLSNFYTSSLERMISAFENCSNLKYINLKNSVNGRIINYTYYQDIFKGTPIDIIICVNETKNKILFDILPNKNCFIFGNESFEKYISNENNSDDLKELCYKSIERNVILITKNNIQNIITTKNICNICNNNYYPVNNNESNTQEYIYCYPRPEGYFFDENELIFEKCYHSCEQCISKGDNISHNCLECKSNFSYNISTNDYLNCYENYSYPKNFEESTYFYTIDSILKEECNDVYNKFIPEKEKCVKNCTDDDIYQYEFRKICYEKCPKNSEPNKNIWYYCEIICNETNPFELIEEQKCVDFCSINDIKLNFCIKKYITETTESDTKIQDKILESIESDFMSGNFDRTNIDKGNDEVISEEKMTITLTTTKNQKENKNKNITIIELGNCEQLLRNAYKLSEEDILYIKKIDVIQEGMKIPKIEFDVYYEKNGTKLEKMDLSICSKTKVDFTIPLVISENIDKLNYSSGYYNDICYPATSESGTDIILRDRKNDFINNNKTVCQENCDFTDYDYEIKKVKCSCEYKQSTNLFSEMNINKTKIYENFKDIKNIMNLNILICYKALLDKNNLMKNIGFLLIIFIFIIHFACIIIFYKKQLKIFQIIIKDITFGIKHYDLVIQEEKRQKEKLKQENKNKKLQQRGKINIYNQHFNCNNVFIINNKRYEILPPVYLTYLKQLYNNSPPIRKKGINNYKNKNNKKEKLNTKLSNDLEINSFYNIFQNKKLIIEKTKKIMKYNETELNNSTYKHALKYDNRTYCQYYLSLIQLKNNLIFSFYYTNDYNSRIVKIDLFFFTFIIYYCVNALFFNDDTMHKIYENEGNYNFIDQLPQILFSSLISVVLNTILKFLSLQEDNILDFKKSKNVKNLNNKGEKLFNKLKIKFLIYFIISFIFLLFFWYYLAMFCAVYKNTQIHLIKDTLISFGLTFVYPFVIYLFPGIFRKIALKNKTEYLYIISKLLQMI